MFKDYEIVIGLEVHAEMKTNSKMFCGCTTEFGGDPNAHVCPVCLGLPGTLPVLNKRAVDFGIQTGLALNCTVTPMSQFSRKNYFYPDLPKAYQISQYDLPLAVNGYLTVNVDGEEVKVRINRVHLEEDAGKLVHLGNIVTSPYSMVDYNRGGVPLMEIVTEPDMHSAQEAKAYLDSLKGILEFLGVSDCKMEEGSLRCDANISLRPTGATELGAKVEIKNMNSFRGVQKGLEYEAKRQYEAIKNGEIIVQETRGWDENKGVTTSMRSKEAAHDYRYFPEPDLVPIVVDEGWIKEMTEALPELPSDIRVRFVAEYGLGDYDAMVMSATPALVAFFDEAMGLYSDAKTLSNWMMGDVARCLNNQGIGIEESTLTPLALVDLLKLINEGTISGKIAKSVFEEMYETGKDAKEIVEAKGLVQISDESELIGIIEQVVADNPGPLADYKSGKQKAFGYFIGQVMKATRGQANPGVVNKVLRKKLDE